MPLAARLKEQITVPLPLERAWDPAIRVVEVPDDDADATLHLHAGFDAMIIVGHLLSFRGGRGREVETDVKFGDHGVDAEFGEGFLLGDLVGEGGRGA